MQDLEFWRTAVYHPLTVHFPIVLIILATLFKLLSLFKAQFKITAIILIGLALVTTWLAYYTGDLADGEVSRQLCDPTVLKTHENYALYLGYLISAVSIIEMISTFKLVKLKVSILNSITVVLLFLSCGILTYVGHLGAQLVYNQAAGVNIPSEDCREFE